MHEIHAAGWGGAGRGEERKGNENNHQTINVQSHRYHMQHLVGSTLVYQFLESPTAARREEWLSAACHRRLSRPHLQESCPPRASAPLRRLTSTKHIRPRRLSGLPVAMVWTLRFQPRLWLRYFGCTGTGRPPFPPALVKYSC